MQAKQCMQNDILILKSIIYVSQKITEAITEILNDTEKTD